MRRVQRDLLAHARQSTVVRRCVRLDSSQPGGGEALLGKGRGGCTVTCNKRIAVLSYLQLQLFAKSLMAANAFGLLRSPHVPTGGYLQLSP